MCWLRNFYNVQTTRIADGFESMVRLILTLSLLLVHDDEWCHNTTVRLAIFATRRVTGAILQFECNLIPWKWHFSWNTLHSSSPEVMMGTAETCIRPKAIICFYSWSSWTLPLVGTVNVTDVYRQGRLTVSSSSQHHHVVDLRFPFVFRLLTLIPCHSSHSRILTDSLWTVVFSFRSLERRLSSGTVVSWKWPVSLGPTA